MPSSLVALARRGPACSVRARGRSARAWIVSLLLVACGARTGLRTGAIGDAGTTPDVLILPCPSVAQIAQTGTKPDAIAIDGEFVYWHDDQGVSRAPKSGGAVQHIADCDAAPWPDLSPFAIAGGRIFCDKATDGIVRVPISGGTPDTSLGIACVDCGFAASAAHVYFWPRLSGTTQMDRLPISAQVPDGYDFLPEPPNKIVFDSDAHGVATADPDVLELHQGGHQILSGLSSIDVVFDATHVWFTSSDATNGARVVTLVISTLATTPIPDTAGAFAIETDGVDLYFTDRKSLRVRRIANETGPVTDVALSPEGFEPVDLALDGACVYWTSSLQHTAGPGAIMVAPKP